MYWFYLNSLWNQYILIHLIISQQANIQNLFLKSQSLFNSCVSSQSSLEQRLLPHYLTGSPLVTALPHWTSVRHRTTLLDLGDLFLFLNFFGFCYILIDLAVAIFWYLHGLGMSLFWNKDRYGFDLSRDDFFFFFGCFCSCYFGFPTSLFELFHSLAALRHIWKFKLIDIG